MFASCKERAFKGLRRERVPATPGRVDVAAKGPAQKLAIVRLLVFGP
jgi:hypothetical protein